MLKSATTPLNKIIEIEQVLSSRARMKENFESSWMQLQLHSSIISPVD